MPNKISKKLALEYLAGERLNPKKCLICEVLGNLENYQLLYQNSKLSAFLSKYPRTWGHVIVTTNKHLTRISNIPDDTFASCFSVSRQIAVLQESKLNPKNIFISSIGSSENQINTCPHFHIHILPIYDFDIKPSEVFTWENGIYEGSKSEWEDLSSQLQLKRDHEI